MSGNPLFPKRPRLLAAAVLLGGCFFSLRAAPQEPRPAPISVRVDLVRIQLTVADARGALVANLRREDFRLFDEGVELPIEYFAATNEPARVLVLVEAGPAVYLISQQHLAAAHMLFSGLAPQDEVALATYSSSATLLVPFTQDKGAARRALISPQFSLGSSRLLLYESLAAAIAWLDQTPGKKSVVLLSTGIDSGEPGQWEGLLRLLHASDSTIYAVALGGDLRELARPAKQGARPADEHVAATFARANQILTEIADLTGGRAFFPRNASDLSRAYQEIAAALRHQYSLGFHARAGDRAFHRIEVQLAGKSNVSEKKKDAFLIRARRGYIAPAP